MLKRHSQLILALLIVADAAAIAVAWLLSYWLRFNYLPVGPDKAIPSLMDKFLPMLGPVILAHLIVFARVHLYRPRRSDRPFRETRDIIKAFCVAIVIVIVIDYLMPESHKISRGFVATYAIVGTACFALFRGTLRLTLQALRRRGYNQRSAAIVGSGRNAQRLFLALEKHNWTGLRVVYFVDERPAERLGTLRGVPVRGPLSELARIVEQYPVDSIFIALQADQADKVDQLVRQLGTSMADIRIVPEFNPYLAMRPAVSNLDGIPILSLRESPLYGSNALVKRVFDLVIGAICLAIAAVPMGIIALAVKLTSPGPVLYKQRRMGLDGHEFTMLKFRTMRPDAEAETGPVWADRDDARRTPLGSFLRRTSLDELPQLFNVLIGDMSLVGPRPERPEFISQFRQQIPRYMLRHKMKAGMTGYAQVKGLRGNTSLKKRIQHDVHYINNWSLGLDLKILAQTVGGVWFSRHET
ncbi:MAG: undecaprenyl-phosphate glucose phosphotransferase [Phycisphaerae bacterium]|nr:undecaprenyl-phosphate glucose phosphotransferase [Phycisphaerae bacterium]